MVDIDFFISLMAGLAAGLWVYGDARERKLKDAWFWGLAGLLFSLLGLIAYWLWIIRPNKRG